MGLKDWARKPNTGGGGSPSWFDTPARKEGERLAREAHNLVAKAANALDPISSPRDWNSAIDLYEQAASTMAKIGNDRGADVYREAARKAEKTMAYWRAEWAKRAKAGRL